MQKYIEEMAKLKEIIRDQEKLLDETQTLAPPEDMVTEDYGEDFDLGEKSIFKDFEECPLTDDHDCWENAQPYEFEEDGHRFHGWECGICGEFLQSG